MRTTKVVLYSCQAAASLCAWRSRALVTTIYVGIYIQLREHTRKRTTIAVTLSPPAHPRKHSSSPAVCAKLSLLPLCKTFLM